MKITVIGAGYVGLVTAVCLAEVGHDVLCAKKSTRNLDLLRSGVSPIFEPGLSEMLKQNLLDERIEFTTDLERAVNFSEVIFICVGTPATEKGEADLSQVYEVVDTVAQCRGLQTGYREINLTG